MMGASLLLLGSEAGYVNVYFGVSNMAKYFRKSFEELRPDMLVVLGDISTKGSKLRRNKWFSVLQQFQWMTIEQERDDLQTRSQGRNEETNDSKKFHVHENFGWLRWRENALSSGSEPVLLHFPLHQATNSCCMDVNALNSTVSPFGRWSFRTMYNQDVLE